MAAGLIAISAVGSAGGDDGDRRVEASSDAEADEDVPTIDEASATAVESLGVEVSRARMAVLVSELCDGSRTGAARALSTITSDADDQLDVLEAAGEAAEDACPDTARTVPGLLNMVYAAVSTTTTTADTATVADGATSTAAPTTTTTAPRATTPTAGAPAPTQPPATQPPATQPPATQPPSPQCHPSYSGACLDPTSPDYDCAGGSGNGPDYTGPVQVVGPDEYGLDADNDGYGCEA